VLALCVALLAVVPAAVAIDNGAIVFQGYRHDPDGGNKSQSIFTMAPSGGPAKRIVPGTQPSISRNGRTIAYVRGDDVESTVWTMDANGGNQHQIVFGKLVETEPALSPDGKRVVFVGDTKNLQGTHLYIADADGSGVRQLTSGDSAETEPAFSPDGKRIAFIRPNEAELMTMSANGGDITKVTAPDGPAPIKFPRSPSYAPNGVQIVFSGIRGSEQQVYSVYDNGNSLLPLTKGAVDSIEPSVAPNGSGIVFRRGPNLFTITMLGTDLKQLTSLDPDEGTNSHPSWGG
jgi:TolB protein